MAKNDHFSAAFRNSMLDILNGLNSGFMRWYSGTQPANVAAAITGTILAEPTFAATAFAAASAGSKTANAITDDSLANANGTATHYRCFASDGTTAHVDGNIGTVDENLVLNTTSIVANAACGVTSFVASIAA